MKKIISAFLLFALGVFIVVFGKGFFETAIQKREVITQNTEKIQNVATSSVREKSAASGVSENLTSETPVTALQKKIVTPAVSPKPSVVSEAIIPPIPPKKIVQTTTEPLVSFAGSGKAVGMLESAEVVRWTNYQREQNNLLPLARNSKLDAAAIVKVHDMFDHQYFEHVSPNGKDASALVTGVGYEYLWVGENLALGIFDSEKALVDAWMGSPGHRANILNPHFEEIGVAVDEGQFEGRHVWLAVQEFGKPASSCPAPEISLKLEIEQNQMTIASSTAEANVLAVEIDSLEHGGDRAQYIQTVADYNTIVDFLNPIITRTRGLVDTYNQEVASYNACIGTADPAHI